MIPKKIHYCWFGKKELPEEYQRYLDSWKKYCPDYEIIKWNEDNYDITANEYMYAAYQEKRWGFVPDYARFDIVCKEGGFYFDTDVELIRSIEPLRQEQAFIGMERGEVFNPGLGFGAEKGNPVMRELRDMYQELCFYRQDGSLNLTPSPYYVTQQIERLGGRKEDKRQGLENISIYPSEYFAPMDYNTGKLQVTENTYSIHHYSTSWMTEEEKRREERRKRLCVSFGNFAGNKMNGLCERAEKIEGKTIAEAVNMVYMVYIHFRYSDKANDRRLRKLQGKKEGICTINPPVLLTPALQSANLGDVIIEEACENALETLGIMCETKISTHTYPRRREERALRQAGIEFVAGSNLLSPNMSHGQWKLPNRYESLEGVCLLGCGWSCYNGKTTDFSREFYQRILKNNWLHSVRDRYTEERLRAVGVDNVINTGCPTMWSLTKEHCKQIPKGKGQNVVTAVTCDAPNRSEDVFMLETLLSHYERVYFWQQSEDDRAYLEEILKGQQLERLEILPRSLEAYGRILEPGRTDYVGNRLHAGIRALNRGCRSLIVSIDNRAAEIGRDTGLPIVERENLRSQLANRITQEYETVITLPWKEIEEWKNQFLK